MKSLLHVSAPTMLMRMMPYAELPNRRIRQIVSDIVVVLWILVWIRIGDRLFDVIDRLGEPGRAIRDAGASLARRFDSIAERISDVPFAGDELRAPFTGASRAFRTLERAGAAQANALQQTARWVSVVVLVLPLMYALFWYLPKRVRWMRDAAAARSLRGNPEASVLAHRFIASRPIATVATVPNAAEKLRNGDYDDLVAAEMTALGLRST